MASREEILERLRRVKQPQSSALPDSLADKSFFKDYPLQLYEAFIEKFKALSGEIYLAQNYEAAAHHLHSLIKTNCLIQQHPLSHKLIALQPALKTHLATDEKLNISSPDFAGYDMGVTAADYLVARTGSIVLNARHMGGRRLSVLPPTHVVLAMRNQIVPSLEDVLRAYAAGAKDWSYATIITGASRTADIEKILVLGAHGPKRLILILIA
jgi:L-lactate dehydrogenase complex protein LldG